MYVYLLCLGYLVNKCILVIAIIIHIGVKIWTKLTAKNAKIKTFKLWC